MNKDLPSDLTVTRDLLAGSLNLHPIETAPKAPRHLLTDLESHFARRVSVKSGPSDHWFSKLIRAITTPAFGAAAVAAIVLVIASPSLVNQFSDSSEVFRGVDSSAAFEGYPSILVVASDQQTLADLSDPNLFEVGSLTAVSREAAATASYPKVVVDYETGVIVAIDSAGVETFSTQLPDSTGETQAAIAAAINSL